MLGLRGIISANHRRQHGGSKQSGQPSKQGDTGNPVKTPPLSAVKPTEPAPQGEGFDNKVMDNATGQLKTYNKDIPALATQPGGKTPQQVKEPSIEGPKGYTSSDNGANAFGAGDFANKASNAAVTGVGSSAGAQGTAFADATTNIYGQEKVQGLKKVDGVAKENPEAFGKKTEDASNLGKTDYTQNPALADPRDFAPTSPKRR
ncbi:hypothetical protein KVT40_000270 [Elsinoe batatas]|uniref:Uncharacterized protein n=1 Tax=Elsinoe batatas TaxID=2601811 RepID=A0A8K0L999_9PEZI|nr:hypothetical protein KVT40_000270 [Elsinoe batatas]